MLHRGRRWADRRRSTDSAAPVTTHRSITFSSSRTLPGHAYSVSIFIASGDTAFDDVAVVLGETLRGNSATSSGMSSRRSRSGGTVEVDDVQAIEQILAERALGDHVAQVAVRRGNDPDVDAPARAIGADLLQLAGLQESEQQPLHPQRHLADFVEENRPFVGELELARLVAIGAGEAALDVAEQLRFEQRLGQAGAVDGDERPCAARALCVDGIGHDLLADAAFAGNQHFGIGPRDALDLLSELDHHAAGAGQLNVAVVPHRCTSCPSTCRALSIVWAGAPL